MTGSVTRPVATEEASLSSSLSSTATPTRQPWYVRPGVVLPLVSVLIVMTALMAPQQSTGRNGDQRLSTTSTEPMGASAVYELARRLGWHVERRNRQAVDSAPDVINVVLDPVVLLRANEAHALLEQVRHGGALLVVLDQGNSALADSLHVKSGSRSGYVTRDDSARSCGAETTQDRLIALWPDDQAHLYSLEWTSTRETPVDTMLEVEEYLLRRSNNPKFPAVMGTTLGAGRVVIASDPDFLRNDAVRFCKFHLDVAFVRALEFLREGGPVPRQRLVFDEYHQRASRQPGTVATVTAFLSGTPSGHVMFQLLGAGLLILVAMAPRAIPPRDRDRIERRSPLEHVDALARAYAQVDGTRTASTLLVRGLRRRVERGATRALDPRTDDRFLQRLDETNPGLTSDIALLRRALNTPLAAQEFALLGPAVERIEHSLSRL